MNNTGGVAAVSWICIHRVCSDGQQLFDGWGNCRRSRASLTRAAPEAAALAVPPAPSSTAPLLPVGLDPISKCPHLPQDTAARHCPPSPFPCCRSIAPGTALCGPAFHVENFTSFELYLQPCQPRTRVGNVHRVRSLKFLPRRGPAEMHRQRDAHSLFFAPAVTIQCRADCPLQLSWLTRFHPLTAVAISNSPCSICR
jgi:hypothetical protein